MADTPLVEELEGLRTQFISALEKRDGEIAELGKSRATTEQKLADLETALEKVEQAIVKATRLPNPAQNAELNFLLKGQKPSSNEQRKAWFEWMAKGMDPLAPETKALLATDTDANGAVLAPPEYVAEIIKAITLISPIRQYAKIRTTANKSVRIPRRKTRAVGYWPGEGTLVTSSQAGYEMIELFVYPLGMTTPISNELLAAANVNMDAEILEEFSLIGAKTEGAAFVNGDGNKKPFGLLAALQPTMENADQSTLIQSILSGYSVEDEASNVTTDPSVTAISYNDVVNLYTAANVYAATGTWVMNYNTFGAIRKIRDKFGRPLWTITGLDEANPLNILGRPVCIAIDMPDIADGATPILFGDLRQGYTIVDAFDFPIIRDPYTQAKSGVVEFTAFKYVGGEVTLADALKVLTINSTSGTGGTGS